MSFDSHETTPKPLPRKGRLARILDRVIPPVAPEKVEVTTVTNFENFLREAEKIHATELHVVLKRKDRGSGKDHVLTHTNEFTAAEGGRIIRLEERYEEGTVIGDPQDVIEPAIAKRQHWTAELRLDEVLKLLPQANTVVSTPFLWEKGVTYGGKLLPEERAQLRNYAIEHKLEPLTPIAWTLDFDSVRAYNTFTYVKTSPKVRFTNPLMAGFFYTKGNFEANEEQVSRKKAICSLIIKEVTQYMHTIMGKHFSLERSEFVQRLKSGRKVAFGDQQLTTNR